MDDLFKSIKAYLYERTTSPLAGAFFLSWSLWNYQFYIAIIAPKISTEEKISLIETILSSPKLIHHHFSQIPIDESLTLQNTIIFPTILCFAYLFIYPFLSSLVYKFSEWRKSKLIEIKLKYENETPISGEAARKIRRQLDLVRKEATEREAEWAQKEEDLEAEIKRLRQENLDIKNKSPEGTDIDTLLQAMPEPETKSEQQELPKDTHAQESRSPDEEAMPPLDLNDIIQSALANDPSLITDLGGAEKAAAYARKIILYLKDDNRKLDEISSDTGISQIKVRLLCELLHSQKLLLKTKTNYGNYFKATDPLLRILLRDGILK